MARVFDVSRVGQGRVRLVIQRVKRWDRCWRFQFWARAPSQPHGSRIGLMERGFEVCIRDRRFAPGAIWIANPPRQGRTRFGPLLRRIPLTFQVHPPAGPPAQFICRHVLWAGSSRAVVVFWTNGSHDNASGKTTFNLLSGSYLQLRRWGRVKRPCHRRCSRLAAPDRTRTAPSECSRLRRFRIR